MITNLLLYLVLHMTITGAFGGLVGAFAYLDRHIFLAESVTHGTFPDAVLGVVIAATYGLGHPGMSTPLFAGVFLGTTPLVAPMRWLARTPGVSSQGAASIVLAAGFASGYFLATWFKPLPLAVNSFLTGSVMTVSPADVAWAGAVLLVALVVVTLGGHHLVAYCFDPANPAAAVRAGWHELIILGLTLALVTVAIPAVGTTLPIVLIAALAVALAPLVRSSRAFFIGTPLFGALLGIAGLAIAVLAYLSAGGTIALLCAACVLASCLPYQLAGPRRKRRARAGGERDDTSMETATGTINVPEPGSALMPQEGRAPEAYRQAAGTTLLAATPIGDVRDASPCVVAALEGADIVATEDTCRALALALHLGIKLGGRLVVLHDHNEAEKAARIVEAAGGGARIVFIFDADMPAVSDPGFRLARAATDAGVPLSVLPGPSVPLVALALSGLLSDRFTFKGFLPRKDGEITRYLQDLATDPHTFIFFGLLRHAVATLTCMAEVFGVDRAAALCHEFTKDYEEMCRGVPGQFAEGADDVLGEVTIVVVGYMRSARAEDHAGVVLALAAEGMHLRDVVAEAAAATGVRKDDLYKAALTAQ